MLFRSMGTSTSHLSKYLKFPSRNVEIVYIELNLKGTMTKDGLMTTTAAAKRLGVSSRTILRWLKAGQLAGTETAGGHWRVSEADLNRRSPAARRPETSSLDVLIIEDDPIQASALSNLVSFVLPAATISYAHDGVDAGLMLGALRPTVAFVDIEMPRLDGIEVIRRARELPQLDETRFVVVSGRLTPERRAALDALGVTFVFGKPLSPKLVESALVSLTAKRAAR